MQELASDPAIGDAFGETLRLCCEGGENSGVAFEIIECSDGRISAGDAVRYFADRDTWTAQEKQVLTQLTGRVLDVGCGAGRHACVLAADGVDAVGWIPRPVR